MGIVGARRLPAASSLRTRLVFATLLWYVAMLTALAGLTLASVRTAGELGSTLFGLSATTGLLRRLIRRRVVSPGPAGPTVGGGNAS